MQFPECLFLWNLQIFIEISLLQFCFVIVLVPQYSLRSVWTVISDYFIHRYIILSYLWGFHFRIPKHKVSPVIQISYIERHSICLESMYILLNSLNDLSRSCIYIYTYIHCILSDFHWIFIYTMYIYALHIFITYNMHIKYNVNSIHHYIPEGILIKISAHSQRKHELLKYFQSMVGWIWGKCLHIFRTDVIFKNIFNLWFIESVDPKLANSTEGLLHE